METGEQDLKEMRMAGIIAGILSSQKKVSFLKINGTVRKTA